MRAHLQESREEYEANERQEELMAASVPGLATMAEDREMLD